MKKLAVLGSMTAALLLVGCASEPDEYEVKEYQMAANPAAVYCVQQDGELETITEDNKRVTYCVLSDEERIEQWEYYRQNHENQNSESETTEQ